MSTLDTYQIQRALETLTWDYGRGDIVAIDYAASTFTVKPYDMRLQVHKFSIVGDSVRAWGHAKVARYYQAPR